MAVIGYGTLGACALSYGSDLDIVFLELDGVDVPPGLWHVILFVTTGETVRRVLEESGGPGYVPMINEIYGRTSWGDYRAAMEAIWPHYLDGERGAESAVLALLQIITSEQ